MFGYALRFCPADLWKFQFQLAINGVRGLNYKQISLMTNAPYDILMGTENATVTVQYGAETHAILLHSCLTTNSHTMPKTA